MPYHDEKTPFIACSSSLHLAGFSHLQFRPPHAIEHCMEPGIACRIRSPNLVYFASGTPKEN